MMTRNFVIAGHSASEDARERAYDPAIHHPSKQDGCAAHKRIHAWQEII
jgi:hypothetical protein